MAEHFTRNTVEASCWCNKCGKPTMHRIDGVKRGPCMVCMMEQIPFADDARPAPASQPMLFNDALVRDKRGD
jgi:hypothetical protein